MRHIIAVPWIIKPLWGFCSDIFPLFQYRRKSYLLVFGLLGFIFENILGLFELRDKYFAFACLFMVQMSIVCCNVVGGNLLHDNKRLSLLRTQAWSTCLGTTSLMSNCSDILYEDKHRRPEMWPSSLAWKLLGHWSTLWLNLTLEEKVPSQT